MPTIYQVPMLLESQGLIPLLQNVLQIDRSTISPALVKKGEDIWEQWKALTSAPDAYFDEVTIALVGKYIELHDSYLSLIKALEHSAMHCKRRLKLLWVDAEHLETPTRERDPAKFHKAWHEVCTANGILVPGGFGLRGTEGMVAAAKWARENGTPYLGICLGMQVAVIEYARNVCGLAGATSEEFNAGADEKLIMFMPEVDKTTMGATMRLGLRPTNFQPGSEWSRLRALYNPGCPTTATLEGSLASSVLERHRHRYEVNPAYIEKLEENGLTFVGKDDQNVRMEIIELKDHPWFVGVQYHPEYLSRVLEPSRPCLGFVAASAGVLDAVSKELRSKQSSVLNGL